MALTEQHGPIPAPAGDRTSSPLCGSSHDGLLHFRRRIHVTSPPAASRRDAHLPSATRGAPLPGGVSGGLALGQAVSLRPSTHRSYETHIRRYLTPYLGNLRLDALRPLHIERMYRELAMSDGESATLSVATLHRIHATLMSALNTAVRRGLVERNPAATVELPRAQHPRVQSWTAEELGRFLEATAAEPLHLLYLLLGLVGLRRGEAVALRWVDVDPERRLLRIERSTVKVGTRYVVGPPKSSSGIRTVALDQQTVQRLHWHRCRQRLALVTDRAQRSAPELVFTTVEGAPLDPAYVSRHFGRLVRRHGLPPIRLHDLRHTSASIGLASGESLVEVSRRLGHSSITITADIYAHIAPEIATASAERLAREVFRR